MLSAQLSTLLSVDRHLDHGLRVDEAEPGPHDGFDRDRVRREVHGSGQRLLSSTQTPGSPWEATGGGPLTRNSRKAGEPHAEKPTPVLKPQYEVLQRPLRPDEVAPEGSTS